MRFSIDDSFLRKDFMKDFFLLVVFLVTFVLTFFVTYDIFYESYNFYLEGYNVARCAGIALIASVLITVPLNLIVNKLQERWKEQKIRKILEKGEEIVDE
ncbi:MAG: hypothetical protein JW776_12545 [Candidatus Lokiarchaeota archaeon]|nr:hypothetical protein [Candidatus Lokiarchaeota archaeon]